MLQILQSPMGAALLPQMHARENLVMDRGNADLQAVITRTANDADENRRRNEMQPHDIAAKQATTTGVGLDNTRKSNDLGVFDARGGVAGAAKRANETDEYEQKKRDFEIFDKGLKGFRDTAGLVKVAPIGQKRAVAVDTMKRSGMPDSVIQAISQLPEEQIDAELAKAVAQMNENAPKFAIQGLKEDRADGRTAATIQGRLDNTALKGQIDTQIAQLKAAAVKMRASAGSNPRAMNIAQRLADLSVRAEAAIRAGDTEEANFLLGLGRDLALAQGSKPEKPPAAPKVTTITRPGPDGKPKEILTETTTTGTPPAEPPKTGTNNKGWGPPRMVE